MEWLVTHQLRILAGLLIFIASIIIVTSYFVISPAIAISLADFYKQYWHILTCLFVVAAVFVLFACSVERSWLTVNWPQRIAALVLIAVFIKELVDLKQIAALLLTFVR